VGVRKGGGRTVCLWVQTKKAEGHCETWFKSLSCQSKSGGTAGVQRTQERAILIKGNGEVLGRAAAKEIRDVGGTDGGGDRFVRSETHERGWGNREN